MRILMIGIALAMLTTGAVAAEPDELAVKPEPRVVCTKVKSIGTRIPRKVCRTVDSIADDRRDAQELMKRRDRQWRVPTDPARTGIPN